MSSRCSVNTKTAIRDYLKEHHTGREKAVFSRELERLFSIDGRNIRRNIHRLRQEGHPICSDANGYFYAKSQEEINDTVRRLNDLVTKVSNARTALLYAPVLPCDEITVEVSVKIRKGG